MSRKTAKSQVADLKAALSWRGKKIRDVYVNELGLVVDAKETPKGLRLVAAFPSKPKKRLIALEPRDDFECLVPDMVKARYQPPRPEDLERLSNTQPTRL